MVVVDSTVVSAEDVVEAKGVDSIELGVEIASVEVAPEVGMVVEAALVVEVVGLLVEGVGAVESHDIAVFL